MADDKPNFLRGVEDDLQDIEEITKEVIEPVEKEEDDIKSETEPKKDDTEEKDDKPAEEVSGEPAKGDKPADGGEVGDEKKDEKSESVKEEEPEKKDEDGQVEPEKKEEPKTEEKPKEGELIFGKYKTIDEAQKAYKEIEGAFHRANQTIEAYKTGKLVTSDGKPEELTKMINTPLIPIKKPRVGDYTDKDGIVDLESYMSDYTKELVLGMQRSFLGGPLAAIQFGMLKDALLGEHSKVVADAQNEQSSQEIVDKLYADFPILKSNKDIEDVVSKAITGAKLIASQEAKANGKEPSPFTYDDYSKVISRVLGSRKGEGTATTEDPVEKVRGQAVLTTKSEPRDEMDDILEGMAKAGNKSQLF